MSTGGQRGFSYVEVMVATVILAVALLPALNALTAAIAGTTVHRDQLLVQQQLNQKMEEVLAKPFGMLYAMTYGPAGNAPSTVRAELSDPAGAGRRIVNLYRVDGATASNVDTGLLRIRVAFEDGGDALETLKGRWW